MLMWIIRIFRMLLNRFEDLYFRLHPPELPPLTCPIGWQPNGLAPVFYGFRDYGTDAGAPGLCRVFFPSLDGAPATAPILRGCGRYPLVLFAHGHCDEMEHYKKWYLLPAQLARSGYVVVAPEIPSISINPTTEDHPALPYMAAVAAWMREGWGYRGILLPSPATGVIGHSYGATLAARFAVANEVAAYASIAARLYPIEELATPMFYCWGTEDMFTEIRDPQWMRLREPKYKAVYEGAQHWDYLRPGSTACESDRGPCPLTGALTADLVTMFFTKYLPPDGRTDLSSRIPANLIPPPLMLTTEQEFYAGGHLLAFSLLESRKECRVTLTWSEAGASHTITRP